MIMTNEDWKYKIINASPTRLVIVTYEIVLDRIGAAEKCLDTGELGKFRENITNAREFITEMAASLDMGAPISGEMINLYLFINKQLTKAYFSFDKKYLKNAEEIVSKLMSGLMKEVDDGIIGVGAEACGNYTGAYDAGRRRY